MGTQQHVGDGRNQYIFPGMSPDGGKLIIHANDPGEANRIIDFIKGLRGGPTNTQIIAGLPAGGHELQGYHPPLPQAPMYEDGYGYGYDSGGGGGGMAPPRKLAESPEWLAYLNALGYEENQFRADIERQRQFASSEALRQIQGLEPGYKQQRRGIAGNAESRGMTRSGEFLRNLAESRAAQGRDQANIQAGLGNTINQLESQLANRLMDLNARRADKELSLRAGGYV